MQPQNILIIFLVKVELSSNQLVLSAGMKVMRLLDLIVTGLILLIFAKVA